MNLIIGVGLMVGSTTSLLLLFLSRLAERQNERRALLYTHRFMPRTYSVKPLYRLRPVEVNYIPAWSMAPNMPVNEYRN